MDAVVEAAVKLLAALVTLLAILYWIVHPKRGQPL